MEKEFVPYELALRLKALGFDESCFGYWNIDPQLKNPAFNMVKPFKHEWCLPAPTFSQAFRWFREKHGLYGIPEERTLNNFSYQIKTNREGAITFKVYGGYPLNFISYDEAELACIEKLIKIVEQTN
jgi:hypothetical protein